MIIKVKRIVSEVREATASEELAFKLKELYNICNKIKYEECANKCILNGNCPIKYEVEEKLIKFLNTHEKI